MRRALLALMTTIPLSLGLAACGDKDAEDEDEGGDDTAGDDGGDGSGDGTGDDGGSTTGCPDEVPEEYRYIWDCQAENCDGSPVLYRYGVGSSDASGGAAVVEQWFMFNGGGDYCVDTFEIEGDFSPVDPNTFNCSECERTFEVSWDHTGMDCGVIWGGIFYGQDGQSEEAPYDGYLMFDTHTAFGNRNPDNAALVVAAPVLGGSYYPKPDWARGTATPTDTDPETGDEYVSEDFTYVNSGSCLGMTGTSGPTLLDPKDDAPDQVATPLAP